MGITFYPKVIGIELVRGCNFSCKMCPVPINRSVEDPHFEYIDILLLKRICQELDQWPTIKSIFLFHFGEPLTHPQFRQCLEVVFQSKVARDAQVIMYTNGSLLKGEKAQALLDIPIVRKLVFSFDGFGDRESYEMMRGVHYTEVMQNIVEFAQIARKKRPELILATSTILPKEGEVPGLEVISEQDAITNLEKIFNPLGINVEVRDLHDYSGNDPLEIAGSRRKVWGGCGFIEQDSLYFTVKGNAQPCCAVYNESFNVGSIMETPMIDLLNSEKISHIRNSLRLDCRNTLDYCRNCALSIGGYSTKEYLKEFWIKRDEENLIDDLTERKYIFENIAPEPHRTIRVDLGCGKAKLPGFIGIDRFPLPGVDIVADINRSLPLADNSVDYILASHSLEHFDDIMFIMQEIYRVCKHKALVCIVAPYYHTSLNMANPFHKQVFNEHTPRFYTVSHHTLVPELDYIFPQNNIWGLGQSDNRVCVMDFRCLRMEFFYFPQYRALSEEDKRKLRQSSNNVVDQIMYHLLVVKESLSDEEIERMSRDIIYQEPPYVAVRRYQDAAEVLKADNDNQKSIIEKLSNINETLKINNEILKAEGERLIVENKSLKAETGSLEAANKSLKAETGSLEAANKNLKAEGERLIVENKSLKAETGSLEAANKNLKAEGERLIDENQSIKHGLKVFFRVGGSRLKRLLGIRSV